MSKIIINIILLCFIPRLYAPVNIYEDRVAKYANTFAKEYAGAINEFEKAYHAWVEIKNATQTVNHRGELEKQKYEEALRAWSILRGVEDQWQQLNQQVKSLP